MNELNETIEREVKTVAKLIYKCLLKEQGIRKEKIEGYIRGFLFIPKYAVFSYAFDKYVASSDMIKKSFMEFKDELNQVGFTCKFKIVHVSKRTHRYEIIVAKDGKDMCRLFYGINPIPNHDNVYTDFELDLQYRYSMYETWIDTVVSYDDFFDIAAGIKQ
jgi:hypothetical protein